MSDDRQGAPGRGRIQWSPSGPGSKAPIGRRVGALFVDWMLSWCVAALVTGVAFLDVGNWVTLSVFALENVALVATVGYTVGHRLLSVEVRPVASGARWVGPLRAAVRTMLLCLVIPAVIWDGEGRGLHDRAAGTVIVRR